MNQNRIRVHLTTREISQWLVEGPSPEWEEHLETCWTCQAKLAEARDPLIAFRSAVVGWSEANAGQPARVAGAMSGARSRGLRLWAPAAGLAVAALALAAFLLAGSGGSRFHAGANHVAKAPAVSDSDAVLMDQVDAEVSEAVPDAMAPLTELVAWDSRDTTTGQEESGIQAVKRKSETVTKAKVAD